jgi:thioesterase domain-containing protein
MARCLQAQGRDVVLLVLIDSRRDDILQSSSTEVGTFDETRLLIAFAETQQRARGQGRAKARLSYHELHRLTISEQEQAVLDYLKAEQIFPQETSLGMFRKRLSIIHANLESQRLYCPQELYQGDLVFLCSQDNAYDPVAMWQPFVAGQLLMHTIPSEHLVMMREPSVQLVAAELQHYL